MKDETSAIDFLLASVSAHLRAGGTVALENAGRDGEDLVRCRLRNGRGEITQARKVYPREQDAGGEAYLRWLVGGGPDPIEAPSEAPPAKNPDENPT